LLHRLIGYDGSRAVFRKPDRAQFPGGAEWRIARLRASI